MNATMPQWQDNIDLRLHELTRELTEEFSDLDPDAVRDVVQDSYASLMAHVPRTAWSYVLPWARRRLVARRNGGREPSLTEALSMRSHHL